MADDSQQMLARVVGIAAHAEEAIGCNHPAVIADVVESAMARWLQASSVVAVERQSSSAGNKRWLKTQLSYASTADTFYIGEDQCEVAAQTSDSIPPQDISVLVVVGGTTDVAHQPVSTESDSDVGNVAAASLMNKDLGLLVGIQSECSQGDGVVGSVLDTGQPGAGVSDAGENAGLAVTACGQQDAVDAAVDSGFLPGDGEEEKDIAIGQPMLQQDAMSTDSGRPPDDGGDLSSDVGVQGGGCDAKQLVVGLLNTLQTYFGLARLAKKLTKADRREMVGLRRQLQSIHNGGEDHDEEVAVVAHAERVRQELWGKIVVVDGHA